MGYPDFVCLGFQKCGTTTLYAILKQHPQIALCRDVKEPMYYRVPVWHIVCGGTRFYNWRYFGHIQPGDTRLTGEINAGLTYGGCAKKVSRDMSPDTKLIFMMRNPVDRSYSAYRYFLARGFLPARYIRYDEEHGHAQGFDYYVHSVLDHPGRRNRVMKRQMKYVVLSQSNYATCISEYLEYFDRSNMKFVLFEEFVRDQHAACREIYEFIGVPDAPEITYDLRSNEGNERAVSPHCAKKLYWVKGLNYLFYDLCAMPRWGPKRYEQFRRYFQRVRKECLAPDPDKSKVLPETRAYLMNYFDEEICRTEKLTGRDLHGVWGSRPAPSSGGAVGLATGAGT
ncbi:MAG: sulfotransferase domain-containing protein [Clostridiales bacterium]|nr:sulfotransferase domain-containing protein [Clostridiales bacterium]